MDLKRRIQLIESCNVANGRAGLDMAIEEWARILASANSNDGVTEEHRQVISQYFSQCSARGVTPTMADLVKKAAEEDGGRS